jgi:PadR family transcriptional regulator AphA
MTAGNVGTRHLILGLLAREPMSGYDIKRFLKSLNWLTGSPSFGSLYSTLHALLQDGLVTEESSSRQNRRTRKVYSITQAGKQALQDWINQPVAPDVSLKNFVMRLVLAGSFPRAGLIAHLQQRRSQVAIHLATLEQITRTPDGQMDFKERLALDFGLNLAVAELAWLDSALNWLFQLLPTEVAQGESVASEI